MERVVKGGIKKNNMEGPGVISFSVENSMGPGVISFPECNMGPGVIS